MKTRLDVLKQHAETTKVLKFQGWMRELITMLEAAEADYKKLLKRDTDNLNKLIKAKATITALEAEKASLCKVIALYERDIPLLTRGMEFHPKGWEHLCECHMCMSYEPEQSK